MVEDARQLARSISDPFGPDNIQVRLIDELQAKVSNTYIREGGAKVPMVEVASILPFRCESIGVVVSGLGGPLCIVR